jgi:hypothetical protein
VRCTLVKEKLIYGIFDMDKNQKIILGVLIGFILLLSLFIILTKSGKEITIERVLNYKYNGIVIKKYRDKKNHNNLTIKLSTGKNVPTFTPDIYHEIMIGDSLYKKKNSLYMNVFRNDSLYIKFNHLDAEKINYRDE